MTSLFLTVCDERYLDHAKALIVGAKSDGNWQGDFCILVPDYCNIESVKSRGIYVVKDLSNPTWTNAIKFKIFLESFRRWDRVLYVDCDCLIQGDLHQAIEQEAGKFPKILMEGSQFLEGGLGTTILQDWGHFAKLSGVPREDHQEAFQRLEAAYPFINQPLLASSVMLFEPRLVPEGTVTQLIECQDQFREINPKSYDQQVMNLVLHDHIAPLSKNFATWWAFGEPCNLVESQARGWTGKEDPAILHYWSAFAPWLEKTPDAGAYFNHKLNKPCRTAYLENLSKFDQLFPRR